MNIVVYYENPADIRVSIDGLPHVDTRTAFNQIVNGRQTVALTDPFGPFFDSYGPLLSDAIWFSVSRSPLFDLNSISEGEYQVRLQSNLLSLKRYLSDPDIDITCVRGKPPQ
jgi:hypothetical protein